MTGVGPGPGFRPRAAPAMSPDAAAAVLDTAALDAFRAICDLAPLPVLDDLTTARARSVLADVDLLVTGWGCPPLDAAALAAAPRPRAVVHTAGSVRGHITEACWERGVEVSSAAAANAVPVAEYTPGMILAGDDPHYGRQAYSTRTGPTAPGNVADNHLSVEVDGRPSTRRRIHPLGAGHGDGWGWAASWHRPVFVTGPPMVPGLRVESVTVAYGRLELRVHRVIGAPDNSLVTQTGWATGPEQDVVSALFGLHGWDPSPGTVRAPGGTAWTRWAEVPRLTGPADGTCAHVALAALTAEPDPVPLADAVSRCVADERGVDVIWADGARTRVAFDPPAVSHEGNR
ncbi:hypothetical protein ACIP4X_33350 [Streptomyces sp. NPDC088817]|uniref:hypothetical protein n=1 Tax=unclassified Streptomyces TaxID=2593676 RepID=UPI0036E85B43